ncbi:ATPase, AAA family protein, partial [Toxoplasma gondii VAND]
MPETAQEPPPSPPSSPPPSSSPSSSSPPPSSPPSSSPPSSSPPSSSASSSSSPESPPPSESSFSWTSLLLAGAYGGSFALGALLVPSLFSAPSSSAASSSPVSLISDASLASLSSSLGGALSSPPVPAPFSHFLRLLSSSSIKTVALIPPSPSLILYSPHAGSSASFSSPSLLSSLLPSAAPPASVSPAGAEGLRAGSLSPFFLTRALPGSENELSRLLMNNQAVELLHVFEENACSHALDASASIRSASSVWTALLDELLEVAIAFAGLAALSALLFLIAIYACCYVKRDGKRSSAWMRIASIVQEMQRCMLYDAVLGRSNCGSFPVLYPFAFLVECMFFFRIACSLMSFSSSTPASFRLLLGAWTLRLPPFFSSDFNVGRHCNFLPSLPPGAWASEGSREPPAFSRVTFADVAGHEEAKHQLRQIIHFLKTPHAFDALGARVPRGVLLEGPSGTGEQLARR